MLQNHFRIARTLLPLRFSQPAYRVWKELRLRAGWTRRLDAAHDKASLAEHEVQPPDAIPAVPLPPSAFADLEQLVAALDRGWLPLLNTEIEFAGPAPDWRLGPQSRQRLEAITLHYHEWLFQLANSISSVPPCLRGESAAQHFVFLLSDWLDRCDLDQAGPRSLAWNPYAIATRLGWWVRIWQTLDESFWQQHEDLRRAFLASLWRQAEYLSRNLEWDLRANHLLRDAVGLAWAGCCFRGATAERWLDIATKLAVAQADEQVLPDGGHFERSPMYHLEVMQDWQTLAALLPDAKAQQRMRSAWSRMAEFAAWLQHPSGEIPQFNDAALRHVGRMPSSVPNPTGGRHFESSGVIVWHGPHWSIFFDVGEIGPACQPGHAHADTLTLEASFAGRRLFVDPGCFGYDHDERRRYDRSTAAHNTVGIDGHDSSEVWHIFRVGRRAIPRDVRASFAPSGFQASAEHDGFDHLPGRPRHRRELSLDEAGGLQIVDRITGRCEHEIRGGLLLAPDWQIARRDGAAWELRNGDQTLSLAIEANRPIEVSVALNPLHPDFGIEVESSRIEWSYRGELPLQICTRVVECEKEHA